MNNRLRNRFKKVIAFMPNKDLPFTEQTRKLELHNVTILVFQ
jgi:hypothetical protein